MNAPRYLQLNKGGTFGRMVALRAIVAESTQGNRPPSHAVADWRTARRYGFHDWADAHGALAQGRNTDPDDGVTYPIWYCHTGEQFRNETFIDQHENVAVSHRGWFNNEDCSSVLRAFIFNLPHGRFGCGYADSDTGERVYLNERHDDPQDAANSADCIAQRAAEEAKEHDERWHEKGRLLDQVQSLIGDIGPAFALRNHPLHGENSRDSVHTDIAEVRRLRDVLADDFADVER